MDRSSFASGGGVGAARLGIVVARLVARFVVLLGSGLMLVVVVLGLGLVVGLRFWLWSGLAWVWSADAGGDIHSASAN